MRRGEIRDHVVAVIAVDVMYETLVIAAREALEADRHHGLATEVAQPRSQTVRLDERLMVRRHETRL
jgi:hypothetical protein